MSKLLGYISVLLVVLLCLNKEMKKHNLKLAVLLKKYHTFFVFMLLMVSLIHGILAGKKQGMMSGKVSWMILLITLFLMFLVKNNKIKMKLHHILSVVFIIICISHIIFLW